MTLFRLKNSGHKCGKVSEGILRRLIRRKKGCHKEHLGHKVLREIVFVPFVFFMADLAFPNHGSPPWEKKALYSV